MKKNRLITIAALAAIAVLAIIPFIASSFFITMSIRIMYFGLLTLSFSFLAGQLGLMSLMVTVPFAISGYTIAILEHSNIMFFPSSAIIAILLALAVSALFGILVNRSKETYFLMLTLVLGQLVWAIVLQWVSLTKGTNGISGIKIPAALGGNTSGSNVVFYYVTAAVFIACILGLYALIRSPYGMKLRGIRESESRMVMLGYNVSLIKWSAFMIAAFLSSLAGMFFVYYSGIMNPDSISLNSANQIMISSIFGGIDSIVGAIVGTAFIKTFQIVLSGITQRYLLITGIIFLVVMLFAPKGLMGIFGRIKDKTKNR